MNLPSLQPRCYCRPGLIIALMLLVWGCAEAPEGQNEEEMPTQDVKTVMESNVDELMAIDGVTGVAIGETDTGVPCILILILTESDEIKSRLPKSIEGHPVRLMVSGEIKPMTDK